MSGTLFGEHRFVAAVARTGQDGYAPVQLAADLWGMASPRLLVGREVHLGPFGLYAAHAQVDAVVAAARTPRTISVRWNVRFDHAHVADALARHGFARSEGHTHVLAITGTHEQQRSGYSATRRRQVRRAASGGVSVRRATDARTIDAYVAVHRKLSADKGRREDYPAAFFVALAQLPDTELLVAEREGVVIGGAVFFRDHGSLFYWHGASDRAHADVFPTCALFDHAIGIACQESFATVNFGASAGVSTLEEFKASWGAEPRSTWKMTWTSPFWNAVRRVERYARRVRRR